MNFYRYFTKRRIYRWGMLISAVLTILIVILTYFGQNSGNFVMSLDDEAYLRGIALSTDPEFRTQSARLVASPVEDVRDMTYSWIDLDAVKATNGDYKDEMYKYMAFTFYIKNTGVETANISGNLDITSDAGGVADAIRVLIIEDDETENLYMKEDTVNKVYEGNLANAKHFISDTKICSQKIVNLRPNQYKKYSIIIWLEGEDPECIQDLQGGRIKMQLVFTVDSAIEGEE